MSAGSKSSRTKWLALVFDLVVFFFLARWAIDNIDFAVLTGRIRELPLDAFMITMGLNILVIIGCGLRSQCRVLTKNTSVCTAIDTPTKVQNMRPSLAPRSDAGMMVRLAARIESTLAGLDWLGLSAISDARLAAAPGQRRWSASPIW